MTLNVQDFLLKQTAPAVKVSAPAMQTAPVQQPIQQSQPVVTVQNTTPTSMVSTTSVSTVSYTDSGSLNNTDIHTLSKLEDEKEENKKFTREEKKASYSEFIDAKHASGIKTTSLGNGEADFSDYGAALSDELKDEIIDSFDTEADFELQASLAGLYTNKSVMNTDQFMAAAREMGYDVAIEYVGTSYISDNKFDGHYDTDVTNGAIGVLTIKDPSTGAEIKIADANGNGAIESEELFMNEILQEISANIDTSQFGKAAAVSGASGSVSHTSTEAVNLISSEKYDSNLKEYETRQQEAEEDAEEAKENKKHQKELKAKEEKENAKKLSDKEYKKLVDSYIEEYLNENEKEDATKEEKEELRKEAVKYAKKEASKKQRA